MQAALKVSRRDHPREVLLINQDEIFYSHLRAALEVVGIKVFQVKQLDQVPHFFVEHVEPDVILIDASSDLESAQDFVRQMASLKPRVEIVVLVNDQLLHQSSSFWELGVTNIFSLAMGFPTIAAKISENLLDTAADRIATPLVAEYPEFVGCSARHYGLLEQITRMKDASASVLIAGESGTGKELVARALYQASESRSRGKFEAINCGAIPEALLESELFGHKRGAFTDAKADKKGLFEVCSGGVLFLDEIGEMPLQLQVKLLRVLQEKEVRPLGSTQTILVDTRVVAATNRNLLTEVGKGHFRKDLYYRLAILKIQMPALQDRREDIPQLANHFLEKYAKDNGKELRPISTAQMARLKLAPWPGNIRELQNAIERAVILARGPCIDLDDIFDEGIGGSEFDRADFDQPTLKLPLCHSEAKKMFESLYLKNLLKQSRGNVSEAAKMAEKTRVEIYRYLSRNHIEPSAYRLPKNLKNRKGY